MSNLQRHCNECTLCCKLLPVAEIHKQASVKCIHQRSLQGCAIYHKASFPLSCRAWSCVWLLDSDTIHLARPDRSHYVIDPSPDYVTAKIDDEIFYMGALQIWVDPNHREAHRDPALRNYLLNQFERFNQLGLIRYNSVDAIVLIPPALSSKNIWLEHPTSLAPDR